MAKNNVFPIPEIKKTRTYTTNSVQNGTVVTDETTEPLRELDKRIYIDLFQLAASGKKKISDALLCQDCIDQVKNLSDKENKILFTDTDVEYLKEGFEMTAGFDEYGRARRPGVWMNERRELFERIANPISEEEWEKQQAIKKKATR